MKITVDDIFNIIKEEPNDKRLGSKLRSLYWDHVIKSKNPNQRKFIFDKPKLHVNEKNKENTK